MVARWSGQDDAAGQTDAPNLVGQGEAVPKALANGQASLTTHAHAQPRSQPHQPIIINYERPACPACHCRWIVEIDQGEGVALRCWTCKRVVTQDELEVELARPRVVKVWR